MDFSYTITTAFLQDRLGAKMVWSVFLRKVFITAIVSFLREVKLDCHSLNDAIWNYAFSWHFH